MKHQSEIAATVSIVIGLCGFLYLYLTDESKVNPQNTEWYLAETLFEEMSDDDEQFQETHEELPSLETR